jgi:hypothetical protein
MRLRWLLALALVASACEAPAPTSPVAGPTDEDLTPIALSKGPAGPLPLSLEPIPARQGSQVQISGRGFSAGETVSITASKSGEGAGTFSLGQAEASAQGTLDALVLLLPDELESGPHALDAAGLSSGRHSGGTLWIQAREPWIVLDTYTIQPYKDIGLPSTRWTFPWSRMGITHRTCRPSRWRRSQPIRLATCST